MAMLCVLHIASQSCIYQAQLKSDYSPSLETFNGSPQSSAMFLKSSCAKIHLGFLKNCRSWCDLSGAGGLSFWTSNKFLLVSQMHLFFFWPHHMTCRILASRPWVEPRPWAGRAPSPTRCTARESPQLRSEQWGSVGEVWWWWQCTRLPVSSQADCPSCSNFPQSRYCSTFPGYPCFSDAYVLFLVLLGCQPPSMFYLPFFIRRTPILYNPFSACLYPSHSLASFFPWPALLLHFVWRSILRLTAVCQPIYIRCVSVLPYELWTSGGQLSHATHLCFFCSILNNSYIEQVPIKVCWNWIKLRNCVKSPL